MANIAGIQFWRGIDRSRSKHLVSPGQLYACMNMITFNGPVQLRPGLTSNPFMLSRRDYWPRVIFQFDTPLSRSFPLNRPGGAGYVSGPIDGDDEPFNIYMMPQGTRMFASTVLMNVDDDCVEEGVAFTLNMFAWGTDGNLMENFKAGTESATEIRGYYYDEHGAKTGFISHGELVFDANDQTAHAASWLWNGGVYSQALRFAADSIPENTTMITLNFMYGIGVRATTDVDVCPGAPSSCPYDPWPDTASNLILPSGSSIEAKWYDDDACTSLDTDHGEHLTLEEITLEPVAGTNCKWAGTGLTRIPDGGGGTTDTDIEWVVELQLSGGTNYGLAQDEHWQLYSSAYHVLVKGTGNEPTGIYSGFSCSELALLGVWWTTVGSVNISEAT